ncbi:D-alanyl-lipoteichoic acid biosynthesis protein DltD [Ligilactobacillus equi]
MKKRLWNIFGPVILAGLILIGLLFIPFNTGQSSQSTLDKAAVSLNKNIFKGESVKQAALAKNYVPFFGSSELSRLDAFHPAVLAKKYHRSYRPFLLGNAGSQSLSQYLGMQEIKGQLQGKKAVFIISPQWFVKGGANPLAFAQYYSNLEFVDFALGAQNTTTDRFAASRLLALRANQAGYLERTALKRIAKGQHLTTWQKVALKLKRNQLLKEDGLFSTLTLKGKNLARVNKQMKSLPKTYNYQVLNNLALEQGRKSTSSNNLGIANKFWKRRLEKKLPELKDSQKNFNYTKSVEYGDFQLVLNQFAQSKTDVLFIIPPINKKWSTYTGLSLPMVEKTVGKLRYQLQSQGFNNVLDLSKDGGQEYFMQDTIHLGWRGWLRVDQAVKPFLETKASPTNYHLNNYFYSKAWQNKSQVK